MAVGVLKNSNATLAIAVSGNSMPEQGLGREEMIRHLGEVFISVAGYSRTGQIMVRSNVYNFTKSVYGGENMCRLWVDTVRNENRMDEYLKAGVRGGAPPFPTNEGFKKLHDGMNDFILTSHISAFIRNQTCVKAYQDAIDFIRDVHPVPNPPHVNPLTDEARQNIRGINENGTNNIILGIDPHRHAISAIPPLNLNPNNESVTMQSLIEF